MVTHGMTGTRPYMIWSNMKKRCDRITSPDYPNYGGRGITYCSEWTDFENFWNDMQDGYEDSLTLDRIDVDGPYCKENCRWATIKEQQNNRRDNHLLEFNGQLMTMSEVAEITGFNYFSLKTRIAKGMSVDEALNTPIHEVITYRGVTKTVIEFASEYGMTYHQLKKRLMRGWDIERALMQPLRRRMDSSSFNEARRQAYDRYFMQ